MESYFSFHCSSHSSMVVCVKGKPYFYAKELKIRTERLILIVPFSLLFFCAMLKSVGT